MSSEGPTGSFPDPDATKPKATRTAASEESPFAPGMSIGLYTLRSRIGRGGFGEVWRAERSDPHMTVAVKVIRPDRTDAKNLARFAAESQALALLDHPNIAKIHDAGVTEAIEASRDQGIEGSSASGSEARRQLDASMPRSLGATAAGIPYIVMEYVQGVPLNDYCDRERLTIKQRLELMAKICDAVHHAHTQGLIHRDLSPDNILVTIHENQTPEPKIVDFGIAKAVNKNLRLTEQTLTQDLNTLIGKPAYMAPEQAEAKQVGVDTRTDIFSLGVILYEMLTGVLPIGPEQLREHAIEAVLAMLRRERPDPSTRLFSLSDEQSRSAAQHRGLADPDDLRRLLRGRVQHLPMKALRVDRMKRFTSAAAMALDIRNYLEGKDFIEAAAEPWWDKAQRHVRRHKLPYAAATLVILALIGGIIGTTWGMKQAQIARQKEAEQRRVAEQREHEALLAQEAEAAARAETDTIAEFQASQLADIETEHMGIRIRRSIIEKRRGFLEDGGLDEAEIESALRELDQSLTGVNFTNVALDTLDENIFERALAATDERFADQPLVKARLLQTIADTMASLGLIQRAMEPQQLATLIRRQTLGDEHSDTLVSITNMAGLLGRQGNYVEAESFYREVLDARRRSLDADHPDVLRSISNIGSLFQRQGRYADAELYLREALETGRRVHGDEHPEVLMFVNNRAQLLVAQGKYDDAEPLFVTGLDASRRVLGDEHRTTLLLLDNLGGLHFRQGRLADAESYLLKSLEIRRRVLGDEHPDTLTSMSNVGALLWQQGKFADAEPYVRRVLETQRAVLGEAHPSAVGSLNNMGALLARQEKFDAAQSHLEQAVTIHRRVHGEEHPQTLTSVHNLGGLLQSTGKYQEAEEIFRRVLEARRRVLGEEHPDTLLSLNSLGQTLQHLGNLVEAEECCAAFLEGSRRVFGEVHPTTLMAINNMGNLLRVLGRPAEAERFYRDAMNGLRTTVGDRHPNTILSINNLGAVLRDVGKLDEAKRLGAEALGLARAALPPGHSQTAVVLAQYGRTLLVLGHFAESATVLLEARAIFESALGQQHERTTDTALRLADLSDAWHAAEPDSGGGYDAKAAEWRAKLPPAEPQESDVAAGADNEPDEPASDGE